MRNILIVGRERSGTKFVTNILAANLDFAAIQSAIHDGVIETNLFSAYPDCFGQKPKKENKLAALHLLSHEYFMQYSNLEKKDLHAIEFTTFTDLFSRIMEENARLAGKNAWIHKADARLMHEYTNLNANIVVIRREIKNQVWSFVKNDGSRISSLSIVKYIFSAHFFRSLEDYYVRKFKYDCFFYESIAANPNDFLKMISEKMHVDLKGELHVPPYNNSSFGSSDERNRVPVFISRWCKVAEVVFFLFPNVLAPYCNKIILLFRTKRTFIDSTFPSN